MAVDRPVGRRRGAADAELSAPGAGISADAEMSAAADAGLSAPGAGNPFALAAAAARALAERTGRDRHEVAIVLGSGWLPALDALGAEPGSAVEVRVTELPGFPEPTVAGHAGALRSVVVDGRAVLVLLGRVHLYEGHSPATVVHGVRTACASGCGVVVLTNAAGGLNPRLRIGQPVLIGDHLNLTGQSPLTGAVPPPGYPARFVDLTDLYSARLRQLVRVDGADLAEGVYAALCGPQYETPAEVAMLRGLGADLVGMSTALEAIAARHLGAEVLGISLVTNAAAGLGGSGINHEEVLAAGAAAATSVGSLLQGLLRRLA